MVSGDLRSYKSCIGYTVPISLLAAIIDINATSSLNSRLNSDISMLQYLSTFRYFTSYPLFSKSFMDSKTAGCSTFVVIIFFPLLPFFIAPQIIAMLSLSVPPDVKNISPLPFPIKSLTDSLLFLMSFSAKANEL